MHAMQIKGEHNILLNMTLCGATLVCLVFDIVFHVSKESISLYRGHRIYMGTLELTLHDVNHCNEIDFFSILNHFNMKYYYPSF